MSDVRSDARALGVNCRLLLAGLGRKERKGAKQTISGLACSRLRDSQVRGDLESANMKIKREFHFRVFPKNLQEASFARMKRLQYHMQSILVQNLGNERRYIYKDPRQDSGQRNISIRDIRRNALPNLIEICMETPCWCSPV